MKLVLGQKLEAEATAAAAEAGITRAEEAAEGDISPSYRIRDQTSAPTHPKKVHPAKRFNKKIATALR